MLIRFIGDVHGKTDDYQKILSLDPRIPTIQVGDMGMGFKRDKIPVSEIVNTIHGPHNRFIRGNHDSPQIFHKAIGAIPDGYYEEGCELFYAGGAESIDKDIRTENVNWWRDEQLSYREWQDLFDQIPVDKIKTVVTHDCPSSISQELFGVKAMSLTSQALEHLWEVLRGELKTWVFGHWHQSRDVRIGGTRFVCLSELEWKDIKV